MDRFGFGLHVHWVIELPRDVAPAVRAILALSQCACFQQSSKSLEAWTKTDSLIDWTDWFTGWIWWHCWLMFVDVCCELWAVVPGFWVFSFFENLCTCEVHFCQSHMAVPPILNSTWKAKEAKMVRSWITRSVSSQFGWNNANAWWTFCRFTIFLRIVWVGVIWWPLVIQPAWLVFTLCDAWEGKDPWIPWGWNWNCEFLWPSDPDP